MTTDNNSGQPVKTKEEIFDENMGGYLFGYRIEILKSMDEYASQFREGQQSAGVKHSRENTKEWLLRQAEYCDVDFRTPDSIFYHVAPITIIDLIDRYAKEALSSPIASKEQGEERRMELEKEVNEQKIQINSLFRVGIQQQAEIERLKGLLQIEVEQTGGVWSNYSRLNNL